MTRTGIGFDTHRFSEDARRPLVMGGVHIPDHVGLAGHSDADVIAHAITDAVLGAAGLGDMGSHFPDTDAAWKGADSIAMLASAVDMARQAGLIVRHVDCTVVTEQPKIAPHRPEMEKRLSAVTASAVNVKASRAEGLGAIGRVEGAACWAIASLDDQ